MVCMKHRPGAMKIDPEKYKELYYAGSMTNQEIADYFGVAVSALGCLRRRYNMPARSKKWAGEQWLKGKHHSEASKQKISNNRKSKLVGENNPMWKRGWYINSHGYKVIRVSTNKYRLEHRVIMEKHLDRSLTASDIVHHIDGNKLNNTIDNLELTDRKSHGRLHTPGGSLVGIHSHNS